MACHPALFEAVSAADTAGLITAITPLLSEGGKLVIIAGMLIGRISMLSFVIAVTGRLTKQYGEYPTESVLVT